MMRAATLTPGSAVTPSSCLAIAIVAALPVAGLLHADRAQEDRDVVEALKAGDRERSYRAFVPSSAGQHGPAPALVLYNGSGSRVDSLITHWKPVAQKEAIVLLGPTAFEPGAWRIPEDSPDFSREVVEAARAKFPIDPRRVYLFGHSGGGHHVLQVALLESEYFAAVAAHAGALVPDFYPAIDKARRRIPVALWIGTSDTIVPPVAVRNTYDAFIGGGFSAKLTELRGHTHSFAERGPEVVQKAWEFLKREKLKKDPIYQPYHFPERPRH
jgi:poly(3-hydroxybutyrate) depolymerase